MANREELVEALQEEFRKGPAHERVRAIRDVGVQCGPVNNLAEVFEDEHVLRSGILQSTNHPTAGTLRVLASPVLVDGERLPIRHPPPILGQHTDEAADEGWG